MPSARCAAALVGVSEYYRHAGHLEPFKMGALGFEVLLGSLTTTGSLIACGKLQGILPGKPLVFKGQNIFNMTLLAVTVACFVSLLVHPQATSAFYLMIALALVVRRAARDPHRLRGHAGGDVVAQFLRRPCLRRHRLRARQ